MRFESSKALDTIELHLTTDPLLAQAVLDLGEVASYVELDGGRGINLIRVGMAIDALGRYLRDGGVYLYPVAPRPLLSDAELTSKERMVLGRWTDAGLIEATRDVQARVPEIAELTGLPIIGRRSHAELAARYPFLAAAPLRVLAMKPRAGGVLLVDGDGGTGAVRVDSPAPSTVVDRMVPTPRVGPAAVRIIGKATPVSKLDPPGAVPGSLAVGEPAGPGVHAAAGVLAAAGVPATTAADVPDSAPARRSLGEIAVWPDPHEVYVPPLRVPPPIRAEPSGLGSSLLARAWRCSGFDCPSFGEHRPVGQPVPHLRKGVAVCPRHDEHLTDAGPRVAELAVALLVDGLRRRRFMVTADRPVLVGRAPDDPAGISVGSWLHEAAANWISPAHLRLELADGGLVVTDLSTNGTLVWLRAQPQARPSTLRLMRRSHPLGEWDSVELYTGIELCHADRRPKGVDVSAEDPLSVLVDAPTVAVRHLEPR